MITSLNNGSYNGSIIYSADTQSYKAKPTGAEIGGIRNRLGGEAAHRETSLQQLAQLIESGVTIQGAQLRSKKVSDENTDTRFLRQQLFAVDLDNVYKDKETGQKRKLPDAYDTMLGERGVGLSGGERQRVSIARAVMKNPGILIFDEATAAVDSETENLIQTAIERLIRGRTTLMIAHRLSTLRKANKIVVVDKGRIVECGAPDELLKLKGKYYKLVQIQSMNDELISKKREENFD